jgi:predicted Zn-dependent protease with MMP-like domain
LSFDVTDSIAIEFAADLLGVYRGTIITVEDKLVSEVPPILVSTRLGPVWKF